jgi:hypothetical protein
MPRTVLTTAVAFVSVLASFLSFPAAAPATAGGSVEGFVYRHAS